MKKNDEKKLEQMNKEIAKVKRSRETAWVIFIIVALAAIFLVSSLFPDISETPEGITSDDARWGLLPGLLFSFLFSGLYLSYVVIGIIAGIIILICIYKNKIKDIIKKYDIDCEKCEDCGRYKLKNEKCSCGEDDNTE